MASREEKAKMLANPGGSMGYEAAARRYVNNGLKDLQLKPQARMELQEKLIPIVANRMKNDRGRTATRAVAQEAAAARKAKSDAAKKIIGGK